MTFWEFMHKRFEAAKWPSERMWVTIASYSLMCYMLLMAKWDPQLWNVKLFELLIQAAFITGWLNMILAFHFAANKADENKTTNTGLMAEALKRQASATQSLVEAQNGNTSEEVIGAEKVADAAQSKAEEIKKGE